MSEQQAKESLPASCKKTGRIFSQFENFVVFPGIFPILIGGFIVFFFSYLLFLLFCLILALLRKDLNRKNAAKFFTDFFTMFAKDMKEFINSIYCHLKKRI